MKWSELKNIPINKFSSDNDRHYEENQKYNSNLQKAILRTGGLTEVVVNSRFEI